MCALIEETDYKIIDDLVDIILNNATLEEQTMYFNMTDISGRSVGHYLFHNYKLISKIGHLIDWEKRTITHIHLCLAFVDVTTILSTLN